MKIPIDEIMGAVQIISTEKGKQIDYSQSSLLKLKWNIIFEINYSTLVSKIFDLFGTKNFTCGTFRIIYIKDDYNNIIGTIESLNINNKWTFKTINNE